MPVVTMTVNGKEVSEEIEGRTLLVQFLREQLRLTGTHVGCDTSQCGACVVHVDGKSIKSCTMLAIQANGSKVTTVEGLASGDKLHPMQQAFNEHHGLQCGFCTPGILMSLSAWLRRHPRPDERDVREMLSGHLCRCTGYTPIVNAALDAAARLAGARETAGETDGETDDA